MNVMEYLPKFKVKNDPYQYYFVQLVKGNRIMAWQQRGVGDCACELIWPKDVVGGKDTLADIGIWDKLSTKEQTNIGGNIMETNTVQKESVMSTSEMIKNVPETPITTTTIETPATAIEQSVAPAIIAKAAKPVVMIKLVDGTVRARTRGRQPAGSVVVSTVDDTTVPTDTTPTVTTPKAAKPVVMIKLADGTVRARTRGRQPAGSVVVTEGV